MAINPYFNLYGLSGGNQNERDLVNGFVAESIQMYGLDCKYLPRTLTNEDNLFHEDVISSFDSAYTIEAYLEQIEGLEGDDLLEQFGLSTKDQMTLMISQKRFLEVTGMTSPSEGDLFFFPLSKGVFEIKFVEKENQYYPSGTLPSFKIRCEAFDYSGEQLNTGIADVDSIEDNINLNGDPFSDNTELETEGAAIIDFSEANPFGAP